MTDQVYCIVYLDNTSQVDMYVVSNKSILCIFGSINTSMNNLCEILSIYVSKPKNRGKPTRLISLTKIKLAYRQFVHWETHKARYIHGN